MSDLPAVPAVELSWSRIVAWCRDNAPVSVRNLRPAAASTELAAAEAATGRSWPQDLRDWYALHDGARDHPYPFLLPDWMPLPLADVVQQWRRYREIFSQQRHLDLADQIRAGEAATAGAVAGVFLSSFIPIGTDLSACVLFVDTRPGPESGCVTQFMREDADHEGPRWPSVRVMLAEVADCLHTGQPIGHRIPRVVEGNLEWDFVDLDVL